MGRERLPMGVRAFILAVPFGAAAAVFYAIRADSHFDLETALAFGGLVFLSEQFPISLPLGSSYSVTFVITLAAIIVAGPAEAAIASAFGTLILTDPVRRRRPPLRLLFNAGQMALTTAIAGVIYEVSGGPTGQSTSLFPRIVLPLALATIVDFLVNTGLVSTVVSLTQRVSLPSVWRAQYRDLWRGYVAFAPLGLLLAVLYLQGMGLGSVLFLLVPLLVARTAFQAAVKMQGAYDATVRSLIAAIEAKDPYTKNHAQRVSQLAEMVAREYGLAEGDVRVIRYAALMHDVGKLGVMTPVLQKPGKLTPEEYEHMKIHPIRGFEIVGDIDFLRPAMDGIRHHHERLDGNGYPDGLAHGQVPLIARLIMVADAFDSMTSTRSYRTAKTIDEALAELHRCAGTQFDPRAIAALERAITKQEWVPRPEPHEEAQVREEPQTDARVASV